MKEPDLTNWNKYDPEVVPEEKRRLILRTLDLGVPRYYIVVIIRSNTGYCMTSLGTTFWSKFNGRGTHWAWLDEMKVMN